MRTEEGRGRRRVGVGVGVGVINFCWVWFLSIKTTKLNFYNSKKFKPKLNQNRFQLTGFGSVF